MKSNFYANIIESKQPVIGDSYFLQTKEEIKKWLKKMRIEKYTINDDLTIDVNKDVFINYESFKVFPVKFGKIKGDFSCSNNELISLKGCPEIVGGFFNCSYNNLTSLEYCPKEVKEYFDCSYNNLTSLKYCIETVNNYFACSNNKLTTLEYCPKEIEESFYCSNNKLTSLKGSPDRIGRAFDCSHNFLKTLEHCPKQIGSSIDCSDNDITSLKGCPNVIEWDFDCRINELTSLEYCPDLIKNNFEINNNNIKSFKNFPVVKGYSLIGDNSFQSLKDLQNISKNLLIGIIKNYPELDWKDVEWDKVENLNKIITDLYEEIESSNNHREECQEALKRIEELQLY